MSRPNQCARCGRLHEVHVTVQLDDGTAAIVGTGCMVKDNLEMTAVIRSAESAAKRLARTRYQLADLEKHWAEFQVCLAKVEKMTLPEIERSEEESKIDRGPLATRPAEKSRLLKMGDAHVHLYGAQWNDPERLATLVWAWRENRLRELGCLRPRGNGKGLRKKIARIEKQLAEFTQ